jgi:hypothetical protein
MIYVVDGGQVRPALATLGLEPPLIPSKLEGSIALWFAKVTKWIGSLPERLRQVLWIEGEHVVNLVGNLILMRMHRFAPDSRSNRCLKDSATTRPGGRLKKLLEPQWLSSRSAAAVGHPPRARGLSPRPPFFALLFLHFSSTKLGTVVYMLSLQ